MASPNLSTVLATDQQELAFRRKLVEWANSTSPGEVCVGDSWLPRACANCEIEYVGPDGSGKDIIVRAVGSFHSGGGEYTYLRRVLKCNGCGALLRFLLLCEPPQIEPPPG